MKTIFNLFLIVTLTGAFAESPALAHSPASTQASIQTSLQSPVSFSRPSFEAPSSLLQNRNLKKELSDSEVETRMQILQEQKNYFSSLSQFSRADNCKYISSIFTPAIAKTVHLTFDDGPHPNLTAELLNLLKKENIQATFFMLGKNVQANAGLIRRALQEGHLVGNHSYDHSDFHKLTEQQQINQISTTQQLLNPYTRDPQLFRYPYGNSTCFSNQKIHAIGYEGIIGWHVDSCDWAYAANGGFVTDKQAKICEVLPQNKANFAGHVIQQVSKYNGGVILMHDVHQNTIDNVEEIIFRLKKSGYSFMNLDNQKTHIFFQ